MKTQPAILFVFLAVFTQTALFAESKPPPTPILDDSRVPPAKVQKQRSPTRPDADDSRELFAIVYKLHGEIAQPVWMQKQDYDVANCKAGKVLVAGIFQDGSHEAITILQRMHRSEAEQIIKNDPAVKAGLCTATLRRFSAYAPALGTTTKRTDG